MNVHALIPNGAGLRLLVATPDAPDGLTVDVSAKTDADGGVFVHLEPIDCDLEGEQPGAYYPTPIRPDDLPSPDGGNLPIPPEFTQDSPKEGAPGWNAYAARVRAEHFAGLPQPVRGVHPDDLVDAAGDALGDLMLSRGPDAARGMLPELLTAAERHYSAERSA